MGPHHMGRIWTGIVLVFALGSRHFAVAAEGRAWLRHNLDNYKDAMRGVHIKIGLPPVEFEPVWSHRTSTSGAGQFSGFIIDLFDRLALTMGFTYAIVNAPPYSPADDQAGVMTRQLLGSGMVDLLLTVSSNAVTEQDTRIFQTAPVHNSYYSGIVRHRFPRSARHAPRSRPTPPLRTRIMPSSSHTRRC